jgi:MYXO-CTERM domain-containing protein
MNPFIVVSLASSIAAAAALGLGLILRRRRS